MTTAGRRWRSRRRPTADIDASRRSPTTSVGGGTAATVDVERILSTRVDATATLPAPWLVASSLFQDLGWRGLVDGAAVTPVFANGPFAAAWLPAGRHRLVFLYRPRPLLPAALAAAAGLTLAALMLLAPPRRRGAVDGAGTAPDAVR